MGSLDHQVVQHLILDGTLRESVEHDFKKLKSDLEDGGCPILVTGKCIDILGFQFQFELFQNSFHSYLCHAY